MGGVGTAATLVDVESQVAETLSRGACNSAGAFKVKCLFPPPPLQPRNYRYVALAWSKTLTTTVSRLLPYYGVYDLPHLSGYLCVKTNNNKLLTYSTKHRYERSPRSCAAVLGVNRLNPRIKVSGTNSRRCVKELRHQ